MDNLTQQELEHTYQFLSSPNVDDLLKKADENEWKKFIGTPEFEVLKKVASESTFDEFQAFVHDKEAPAVQLSAEEMEMIKGGGLGTIIKNVFKKVIRGLLRTCDHGTLSYI